MKRTFPWKRREPLAADPVVRDLDFPDSIAREFPDLFPAAWGAVERTLGVVAGVDLRPLARRSPSLDGYDWTTYLRCSVVRMVRAFAALRRRGVVTGSLLDYGSYFGNFSLAAAALGYRVVAADSYQLYGAAFDSVCGGLRDAGVAVRDFCADGFDLRGAGPFDAVAALGVIEHVPHTPRPVLDTLDRLLVPGGCLLLDTPNLGYLYTREKLARGESIFSPIERQFYTDVPFEGHHREYLPAEVRWMLSAIGHRDVEIELFNYSVYALGAVSGADADRHAAMDADPNLREIVLASSRKPAV